MTRSDERYYCPLCKSAVFKLVYEVWDELETLTPQGEVLAIHCNACGAGAMCLQASRKDILEGDRVIIEEELQNARHN